MSDQIEDFECINSRLPDLGAVLAQRVATRQNAQTIQTPQPQKFDPHALMVKKKEEEIAPIDPATVQKWPEADVKALEEYCKRMGIVGFSCGRMHPIAALAMLKKQLGDDYSGVPLEERVPSGYEKLGSNPHGPNYPYSKAVQQRQILHG